MRIAAAFLLALFALPLFSHPPQAQEKIKGTIGDSKCGRYHTVVPGDGPAGCTHYCVARGAHFILVTPDQIYQLRGDSKLLSDYAGVPRTIVGTRHGDVIDVTAIESE